MTRRRGRGAGSGGQPAIVEQLGQRTQEVSHAASEHASASEEVTAAAEEQTAAPSRWRPRRATYFRAPRG